MPSALWPIFQQNRHLLNNLPAIGASALNRWLRYKYGVTAIVIGVPQSFGGLLNFNPHLHMLVSAGGLKEADGQWTTPVHFDKRELMQMWRLALVVYLWVALRSGAINSELGTEQLKTVLTEQHRRDWIIYISPFMSKARFLRYAGRYVRRPPIPLNHIAKIMDREVCFLAKDTKAKRIVELRWPKEMFVATLSEHVPDRYRHAMRYFGLLAPRSKRRTFAALFVLLRQKNRHRSPRLAWADSLLTDFGVNPLRDSEGRPMHWTGRLKPGSRIDLQ
jgi:hypothetical protein